MRLGEGAIMRATSALGVVGIGRGLLGPLRRGIGAGLLLASFATVSAQATPSFMGLGRLPGGSLSNALAISGDGSTVVGEANTGSGFRSFRWTAAGGMVALDDLVVGFSSVAFATSFDGSVVVGRANTPGGRQAYRWTPDEGTVELGDFAGGALDSTAQSVSADGSVVVGVGTSASGQTAFRWTDAGGIVSLGDLAGGALSSWAYGVSADGSVVAGLGTTAVGLQAFRWTSSGGMVGIGDLPGGSVHSFADGISADGSVVVGLSQSRPVGGEAFRWSAEAGMIGLGNPSCGFDSIANAASSDGSVVVGRGCQGDAFIWDATNGMRKLDVVLTDLGLDLTDWTLLDGLGISDDGRVIVGRGINPNNRFEGWIAVIPEPSTGLLVGAGLGALAMIRGKSRADGGGSREVPWGEQGRVAHRLEDADGIDGAASP